jgi:molybdopterin synthase catalytic subunit
LREVDVFDLTENTILPAELGTKLADETCGAFVSFEGWVRNHNEGQQVLRLEYESYRALAVKEGDKIIAEALARFPVTHIVCMHRTGELAIGDVAVWVGVSSPHRGEAFDACRYVIDEVKLRVPIWKKEYYTDGDSGWVNCEACAAVGHEHSHS